MAETYRDTLLREIGDSFDREALEVCRYLDPINLGVDDAGDPYDPGNVRELVRLLLDAPDDVLDGVLGGQISASDDGQDAYGVHGYGGWLPMSPIGRMEFAGFLIGNEIMDDGEAMLGHYEVELVHEAGKLPRLCRRPVPSGTPGARPYFHRTIYDDDLRSRCVHDGRCFLEPLTVEKAIAAIRYHVALCEMYGDTEPDRASLFAEVESYAGKDVEP